MPLGIYIHCGDCGHSRFRHGYGCYVFGCGCRGFSDTKFEGPVLMRDISEHQEPDYGGFFKDISPFDVIPRGEAEKPVRVRCLDDGCFDEMDISDSVIHAQHKHGKQKVSFDTTLVKVPIDLKNNDWDRWAYK